MLITKVLKCPYLFFKQRIRRLSHRNVFEIEEGNDTIPYFSLKNQTFIAKITSVTGLTDFNVCLKYQNQITKFSARLLGLDKKKNITLESTLNAFLPSNHIVFLIADDFDSDGRLLVRIYQNENLYKIGDMSINEYILINYSMDNNIESNPLFTLDL